MVGSYDSGDDLMTPFNKQKLLHEVEEERLFEAIKYKVLAEGEIAERSKHKHESNRSDTTVETSSKSPLKLKFKLKTPSSKTISPSVTPTPPMSSNPNADNRNESFTEALANTNDSSPISSQVRYKQNGY